MIASNVESKVRPEPLTKEVFLDLIQTAGPCLTFVLPPYRPGEQGQPAAALLKTHLQEAARKLASRRIAQPAMDELLQPLYNLSNREESQAGSGLARIVLRSRDLLRQFELPVNPSPAKSCVVSDSFYIRPMLGSLALSPKIYLLEVSKKAISLLACGLTDVVAVELPKGTPKTLDEALEFDQPDHDLMNRSFAGPSTGTMQGVRFGTTSGRERQHSHLRNFFQIIDRAINELLRGGHAPLVLAGVDEDTAMYRGINTYSNLLEQGIPGNLGAAISHPQVLRQAHDIALFDVERRAALELAKSKERLAPGRFSVDLNAILRAAVEGRVSDLYLDENAERIGAFEGKAFGGATNWHDEDLLNVAAVETLRRSGGVCSLPSHEMAGAAAAAAFRY